MILMKAKYNTFSISDASVDIPLRIFFFFGEYTKWWNLAMAGLVLAIIPVIAF